MTPTANLNDSRLHSQRTILYEANDAVSAIGTGIATYARNLASAARLIDYQADALIGVDSPLSQDVRLNEILVSDARRDEPPSALEVALRYAHYPFNCLAGIRPAQLARSGLVISSLADALAPFRRAFAATRLTDICMAHFKIYGALAQLKLAERPDLFHATHPVPIALKGCPNLYTIHDIVPLRLPYATLDNKKYQFQLLTKIARKADHIVTVSDHSRRDIIEHLGVDEHRVTNTYQSVVIPPHILSRSKDAIANDLATNHDLSFGDYFLYYGAIEPKKNISRLVDAYAASGTKRSLVVVSGGGWQNRADLQKLRDERFSSFRFSGNLLRRHRQVRRLQYLPQDQLFSLIQGARAVLFPSIYEGFGLPVVEAMLAGTPVMTSNVSSLPEIAGEAALLVDPYSIESISHAIKALDSDSDLCRALSSLGIKQAQKFSQDAYTTRLKSLYDRF